MYITSKFEQEFPSLSDILKRLNFYWNTRFSKMHNEMGQNGSRRNDINALFGFTNNRILSLLRF